VRDGGLADSACDTAKGLLAPLFWYEPWVLDCWDRGTREDGAGMVYWLDLSGMLLRDIWNVCNVGLESDL